MHLVNIIIIFYMKEAFRVIQVFQSLCFMYGENANVFHLI